MELNNIFKLSEEQNTKETIKISYYVISYCRKNNIDITNLKLIKLLYFINIDYMLNNNGMPIFDEEFLAWRHGPVLQSVYNYFCFGLVLPSEDKITTIFESIDDNKKRSIDNVLLKMANIDAWQLVEMTHAPNGPWFTIYNKYKKDDGICTEKIPYIDIYNFYKEVDNVSSI